MAIKHVKEYYNQVCDQYVELQKEILDFQKEAEEGLVEPERIDQMKKFLEPLKNNYMTLSWIMYLLNMPARENKRKGYERRTSKFTSKLDPKFSKESIIKQNEEVLKSINK